MRKTFVHIYQLILYKVLFSLFKLMPTDNEKIIYISHYGNRFGCNPKSMYDYIKFHYPQYKNVIVLNDSNSKTKNENAIYVKYYSLSFLMHLATSKYWVVNTNLHPFLKPKKNMVYLQTWHGAGAFKKFGLDLPNYRDKEKRSWVQDTSHWTKLLASSDAIVDIYSSACGIDKNKIYPIGTPRNDVFFNLKNSQELKKAFYRENQINERKKIILYAPTYRDHESGNPIKLDFNHLKEELADEYVFILKLHPFLANYKIETGSEGESFVINLSHIDDIQELLLIADVLITDYSSVIFDYAITGKPMIFYSYDLEKYDRGFYFDYESFVPGPIVRTETDLISRLKHYDLLYKENHERSLQFAMRFNAGFDGKSTEKAVELLFSE